MADSAPGAAQNAASKPKPQGNPAFRALGLPNFRLRLPSRNWTIFLTIVGSWTGAWLYDRREKKRVQQKWAALVSHIADEPVSTHGMARRVTIFLAAPPGDGLRSAREHFLEYVKPVLVAASLDWDVVEGRREGDVRAGLAERVRRLRRNSGEPAQTEVERTVKDATDSVRARTGVVDAFEVAGDIVIGRHTWKEYIRGLHEGWLGPLDEPKPPEPLEAPPPSTTDASASASESLDPSSPPPAAIDASPSTNDSLALLQDDPENKDPAASPTSDDASPTAGEAKREEEPEKKPEEKPKPLVKPPYNTPASYSESELPPSIPLEFAPSIPIAFPHLLGFRNTPQRMYRFLTRRHMADEIGRQTAAAALAAHRPYSTTPTETGSESEQLHALQNEEREWHKSARARDDKEPGKEREWLDDMKLDARIAERMAKFEVTAEDEDRANHIAHGVPGRRGEPAMSDYGAE